MKHLVALGVVGLALMSGCAMHIVQKQATDFCKKHGETPIILESNYSINPLFESASAEVHCVIPDAIVHSTTAFGVDMEGFAGVEGVPIITVNPGSIAAKAGIRPADVVYQFADRTIAHPDELQAAVDETAAGSRVPIKLRRNKKEIVATAQF